mgnify:CR=1 FL=1
MIRQAWEWLHAFFLFNMKSIQNYLWIIISLLLLEIPTNAQNVTIDGVNYYLYTTSGGKWATILPSSDPEGYKGDIDIPIYVNGRYHVDNMEEGTFVNNKKLTSLKMPHISYGQFWRLTETFKGCENLKKLYFYDYGGYTYDSNVLYNYNYESKDYDLAFYPAGLENEEYDVASYCGYIKYNAFADCKHLKRINIGDNVRAVCGFEGCDNLTKINVSDNNKYLSSIDGIVYNKEVTAIRAYPVGRKERYIIPESINTIYQYALSFCNFSDLTIPTTIKNIDEFAFNGTKIKNLYIQGHLPNYYFLKHLDPSSIVYVHGKDFTEAHKYFEGTIKTYETFWTEYVDQKLGKVRFTIPQYDINKGYKITTVSVDNNVIEPDINGVYTATGLAPGKGYRVKLDWQRNIDNNTESGTDYDSIFTVNSKIDIYYRGKKTNSIAMEIRASSDESVKPSEIGSYCTETNQYLQANAEGISEASGLMPDSTYKFRPYAIYNGTRIMGKDSLVIKTAAPIAMLTYDTTQTTITIKTFNVVSDEGSVLPVKVGFTCEGKEYLWNGEAIQIKDCAPNNAYYIYPFAIYDSGRKINLRTNLEYDIIKTEALNPTIKDIKIGPTSIHIKGTYSLGDATIVKSYFDGHPDDGDELILTGLTPNTKYSFKYYVCARGETSYTKRDITTSNITFETQTPKNLGGNSVILSAKTNIEDDEVNAGFEWRKIDAPDVIASKSGNGIIYNGMLEGRINNLTSDAYYKARPFYKANDETMYYGEWVGFDPSDISYFEPIVHTYSRVNIRNNTAILRGVALQGSDDITEQGFEYWSEKPNAHSAKAEAQDRHIVYATGQRMEAEIKNLASNAVYYYRAFAKTSKNTTYGETLQFEVPDVSSVQQIENADDNDVKVSVKTDHGLQLSVVGTVRGKCSYKVISLTGSTITAGSITADGEWHRVSDTNLHTGIYIIQVYDGYKLTSKKVAIR